jgi:hypothetical protein
MKIKEVNMCDGFKAVSSIKYKNHTSGCIFMCLRTKQNANLSAWGELLRNEKILYASSDTVLDLTNSYFDYRALVRVKRDCLNSAIIGEHASKAYFSYC